MTRADERSDAGEAGTVSEPARAATRFGVARYLGYASGDVANNLTFTMTSAFLLIYYTDVAGIAAGTAGTLFLVVRVCGGVADLPAGAVIDKVDTRWGKFRPYLVTASVPLLLVLVAMFSIPGGLGDGGKVVWAYASYVLFMVFYSFVNIPYGSLSAAMTQDPQVRAKLSTARSVAASLTILVVAVAVSPQLSGSDDLQRSLTVTTIAFAVVGYALYVWCFATSQENVARPVAPVRMRDTVAMLRRNRPLVLLCASSFVFLRSSGPSPCSTRWTESRRTRAPRPRPRGPPHVPRSST